MKNALDVIHNSVENRFEVLAEGHAAVLEYQMNGDTIVFTHTGVPPALEGRGIGSALAKAGLAYARANGLKVVPLCSFIARYMERHPEE